MPQVISVDTETTGLELFHNAAPYLVCTCSDEGEYRSWEWPVDPKTRKPSPTYEQRKSLCGYLAGSGGNELVFHHADFDLRALATIGIRVGTPDFIVPRLDTKREYPEMKTYVKAIHDTQLLSHVVDSQGTGDKDAGRHALKPLASYYLDIAAEDEADLRKATISARKMAKKLGWTLHKQVEADYWMPHALDPSNDLCETYCKQDCYRTIGLFFLLQEKLKREGLEAQYEKEMKLLPVTHLMEHFGLYTEQERITKMAQDFAEDYASYKTEAERLLSSITGTKDLNVNSPLQLVDTLEKCGMRLTVRTAPSKTFPAGQLSTSAEALRPLAQWCESPTLSGEKRDRKTLDIGAAIRLIIGFDPDMDGDEEYDKQPGYKTFQKGVEYMTSYLSFADPQGVIHPSYNQVGTAWTRYSCSQPNGQNISKKAVLPLRRLFGPPPGYIWFAIDYSQLELRIYAHASNDENLIAAFDSGYDFHSFSAMQMFGVANPESVTSEQRRFAKNVNFGVIFGAGPAKIDKTSGCPGTYKTYMDKFPNAKKFMARVSQQVEKHGYVNTLDDYRLYVPSDKPYVGTNAVIQGTAGRIIKNAMVAIHELQLIDWDSVSESLPYGGSAIVGNNHDELLIQIPKSYPYKEIGRRIVKVMEGEGTKVGVKTPCDTKLIFNNWAEGEKFV